LATSKVQVQTTSWLRFEQKVSVSEVMEHVCVIVGRNGQEMAPAEIKHIKEVS
jgi:hypothetical protein